MTTQHQAPEVTSELRECPFCGDQGGPEIDGDERQTSQSTVTIFCNGCHASAATENSYAEAAARWNTRATQPLSLTVDEGLVARFRELMAKATEPGPPDGLVDHDSVERPRCSTNTMVWRDYHDRRQRATSTLMAELPALLDRLQSLSLPVGGEQIAENANCSGDILDLADKAVAWALDSFGGYECEPIDAGIHYMQARGKDRWSMQARMDHPECFGCEGTTLTAEGEPCPVCQPEVDMQAVVEALGFDPTNHHNAAKCPYCSPVDIDRSGLAQEVE